MFTRKVWTLLYILENDGGIARRTQYKTHKQQKTVRAFFVSASRQTQGTQ